MFDQLKENTFLSNELKSLHKQSTLHEQKTQNESINCIQLRTTVDKLHSVLAKRCNSDGMWPPEHQRISYNHCSVQWNLL